MENLLKEELFELIEEAGNEIDWGVQEPIQKPQRLMHMQ